MHLRNSVEHAIDKVVGINDEEGFHLLLMVTWISCKGEEGFIENTMDIFSIVNSTYAPLIFVRRVNECFW